LSKPCSTHNVFTFSSNDLTTTSKASSDFCLFGANLRSGDKIGESSSLIEELNPLCPFLYFSTSRPSLSSICRPSEEAMLYLGRSLALLFVPHALSYVMSNVLCLFKSQGKFEMGITPEFPGNGSNSNLSVSFHFLYEKLMELYLSSKNYINVSYSQDSSLKLLNPSLFITHIISSLFDCLARNTQKSLCVGASSFSPQLYFLPSSKTPSLSHSTITLLDLFFTLLHSKSSFVKGLNIVQKFNSNSTHSYLTVSSADLLFYLIYPNIVKYSHYLLDHLLTLTSLSNKAVTPLSSRMTPPLAPVPSGLIATSYYFCSTCLLGIFFLSSFLPYSFGKSLFSRHLSTGLAKFRMVDETFPDMKNETKQNEQYSVITLTIPIGDMASSSTVTLQPLVYPLPTHLVLVTPLLNRVQLSLLSPPNQVCNDYTELIMLSWNILRFLEEFI
jgi:hypothetical protein